MFLIFLPPAPPSPSPYSHSPLFHPLTSTFPCPFFFPLLAPACLPSFQPLPSSLPLRFPASLLQHSPFPCTDSEGPSSSAASYIPAPLLQPPIVPHPLSDPPQPPAGRDGHVLCRTGLCSGCWGRRAGRRRAGPKAATRSLETLSRDGHDGS